MTLSSSYRALIKRHFPNAKIVADRFHVIRLLMKKHRTAKQCVRLIPLFLKRLQQLKESPLAPLQTTLAKTLYLWREEVVRMWRFTKNNGITEGFHRKMKLIQRRAYGFKNFEN